MNIITKTIHEVDYNDLTIFFASKYDVPYEAALDKPNDSIHEVYVGENYLPDDEVLESIQNGTATDHISDSDALNTLYKDGHIPRGCYMISVCW